MEHIITHLISLHANRNHNIFLLFLKNKQLESKTFTLATLLLAKSTQNKSAQKIFYTGFVYVVVSFLLDEIINKIAHHLNLPMTILITYQLVYCIITMYHVSNANEVQRNRDKFRDNDLTFYIFYVFFFKCRLSRAELRTRRILSFHWKSNLFCTQYTHYVSTLHIIHCSEII